MRIFFIGKFSKIHDEEYIARSFESLGHEVIRCSQIASAEDIKENIKKHSPDIILYTKWIRPPELDTFFAQLGRSGVKTVCWVFDLYWNYTREHQIKTHNFFKSDYVFTTDGGNDHRWKEAGINHFCVRQGIYKEECYLEPFEKWENYVIFIGSDNSFFQERLTMLGFLMKTFNLFKWYGREDTDAVRGTELNKLFARSKIVVGDSYPSPLYWSNRVVETLGRGGFLIHRETEGLKEEYPHLVTYNGDLADLKNKINYYLEHPDEREEIRIKNFEWVRDRYTMDKKCAELLSYIK